MTALAGKRAVVGGTDGAYCAELASVLRANGADVVMQDEPGRLDDADIVVLCPPKAALFPGTDLAAMLPAIAAAERWTVVAAEAMRRRRQGVIVHVTGLSGLGGWPGWQASGAAFATMRNLVQSNAVELAPRGVRINTLVAGVTRELAATIAAHSGQPLDAVRARIPSGRFMSTDDLGNALLYLVHDSSSYVTGEMLVADGGWDIWGRLYAAAPK